MDDNILVSNIAGLVSYNIITEEELLIVLNKVRSDYGLEPNLKETPETLLEAIEFQRTILKQTFEQPDQFTELLKRYNERR